MWHVFKSLLKFTPLRVHTEYLYNYCLVLARYVTIGFKNGINVFMELRRKTKCFWQEIFKSELKNYGLFNINIWNKWKCMSFLFYFTFFSPWSICLGKIFLWCSEKIKLLIKKYLLELIKRRSKVHQKIMFWK